MASVSSGSWDGSASRFTIEEWRASCIIDKGGDSTSKDNYACPIREPDGTLNANGVHAAAGRLNQVQCSPAQRAAAARKLVSAYRQLKESPPSDLLRMAGESASATAAGHLRAAHARAAK